MPAKLIELSQATTDEPYVQSVTVRPDNVAYFYRMVADISPPYIRGTLKFDCTKIVFLSGIHVFVLDSYQAVQTAIRTGTSPDPTVVAGRLAEAVEDWKEKRRERSE